MKELIESEIEREEKALARSEYLLAQNLAADMPEAVLIANKLAIEDHEGRLNKLKERLAARKNQKKRSRQTNIAL